MAGERKISVLDVRSDVADAKRAQQAIAGLRKEIATARTEFEKSDRSAGDLVKAQQRIVAAIIETKEAFDKGKVSAQQFLDVVDEATKTAQRAPRNTGGAGGSRQQSATESIDRFGSFGSQVFGAFGASGLGNVAGLVGDISGAVGTLNPIAIAGTVAIGALTLAINESAQASQRAAESLKARLTAEREVNDFLRQATTVDAQNRLAELRRQLQFEQSEFERINAERETYFNANLNSADTLGRGFDRLRQSMGIAFGELGAYDNELTANAQRQSDLTTQIRELSFAVAGGEQAANDLKTAEEELARARAGAIDAGLRNVEERVRFEQELRTANQQTIEKLLENERNRREILQEQINSLGEIADADDNARQKLEELSAALTKADLNIERLSNRLSGFASVRSVLGVFDSIGAGIRNMLTGAQRDLQEQAEKAKRLESAVRPILDEIGKLGIEAAKKDAEYLVKRADIEADFTKQALRDAANFARQRIKIERDAASSMFSAVARRDAQAFFEARERRKEQLDDLRDDAEAQAKLREEERRDKLQALEREIADFRQSNAQKRAELQRQYQYEISAERARLTTAQSAAVARATIEQAGANTVLGIARNFWINMINQAQAAANAAAARSAATPPLAGAVVNSESVARQIAIAMRRNGG